LILLQFHKSLTFSARLGTNFQAKVAGLHN
jgi:hypothetical protein